MRKTAFAPLHSGPGTKVPAGKDWLHEIKYDGYRLIVHRDGDREAPAWVAGRYFCRSI